MALLNLAGISSAPWGAPLLHNIDLQLEAGDIHGIIGANGAGKTSLLRCVSGDLPLASGTIELCGKPLTDWPPREKACQLAMLPQLSLLNFPYTVEEVVALGRTPHDSGAKTDRLVVAETLQALDIEQFSQRLYTQLSGGEKQRVQLARIFAQVWREQDAPQRLILLDEPTTALDMGHQQQLLQALKMLAAGGCAILLVVHDFNLLSAVAGRLSAMKEGRVLAQGAVSEVMTAEVFRQVFDVEVDVLQHPQDNRPVVIGR